MYAAGAGAIRLAEPLGSLDLGTVSEGHGCLSDTRAPAWVHGRLTWGLGSGRPLTFPSPSPSRIRAPGMRGCRAVPSRSSGMAGASYRPRGIDLRGPTVRAGQLAGQPGLAVQNGLADVAYGASAAQLGNSALARSVPAPNPAAGPGA